jgi:tRNA (cmo5U34)-methyltransferase
MANDAAWDEQTSQAFIDYGKYLVPDRETQIEIICDLIPPCDEAFNVLELCCGEGLLADGLLARFPQCVVHGYDGSRQMLERARSRLARYGRRFQPALFDLAADAWRNPEWPLHAVVSSLAIHHLDGPQKQALFRDLYRLLAEGGALVIADVVQPAHPLGLELAARALDDAVRQRSLELDGNTDGFDFFQRERWNMYRYSDDIDNPSRLLDQLKWLESAGFAGVDVHWMKAGHAIFGGLKAGDAE